MRLSTSLLSGAALATLLTGCSWFEKEKPAISGARIAVMENATTLVADPAAANEPLLLPDAVSLDAWPVQGGHPSHALPPLALAGSGTLKEVWRANGGKGSKNGAYALSQPVLANGTLAVMDATSTVRLLEASTGKLLWEKSLQPDYEDVAVISGGVAHTGSAIIASTGYGEVIALAVKDGATLWKTPLPAPARSAPTVRDGRVFVTTTGNELLALALSNGEPQWSHAGLGETAALVSSANPTAGPGVVVVAYSSGEVTALLADSGRVLWFDTLGGDTATDGLTNLADIAGSPVLSEGIVYVASNSAPLVAIEGRTGRRLWTQDIGSTGTPWVSGNSLFVVSSENQLLCLTKQGRIRWVQPLARYEDEDDRDHRISWTSPLLTGGRLFTASSTGVLLAVDPATGKTLSRLSLKEAVLVAPLVVNNTLYVLDEDGEVRAYR
jgi:outer membrane protein assembly factor BamB